ncbi:hypothetical protein [Mucilaginibacter sp.]|uniref:hypothetical protein n=1 Tax=Mucilaginibacter sp. TaxID=1882438 RepID=UPI0035BC9550
MRLLPAFFSICVIALLLGGCKKDAPIYPPEGTTPTGTTGTVTEPEVDNGIDPPVDETYTVPIGAANTIVFKIDNAEPVTLTRPTADVTAPDPKALTGYTSIVVDQVTPEVLFQLNFSAVSVGERANDLLGLLYENFKLSDDGSGKVKTTTFKKIDGKYRIRGYFKVLATDGGDGSKHVVVGSYNIAQ